MYDLIEINIKSLNQTVSLALGEFLVELDRAKFSGVKIIKVIRMDDISNPFLTTLLRLAPIASPCK